MCTFLGTSLITWKSKKQKIVSSSSTESKYRAMAIASDELVWLVQLLRALQIPIQGPANQFGNQLADILTKPLQAGPFHSILDRMSVSNLFLPSPDSSSKT
ncbi:PREDICTED: uncharacterized protein LOC109131542 [Camelina sativa]|uniref:Uncharacterized protein LOC109131542 n=1 Tax=Camelina sativa TaxID=90675 RepID=A0ABM1RGL1_CAMSA|nr:PREDICTED: uncharacterized protein LOC109131542 [Camelina sativa]